MFVLLNLISSGLVNPARLSFLTAHALALNLEVMFLTCSFGSGADVNVNPKHLNESTLWSGMLPAVKNALVPTPMDSDTHNMVVLDSFTRIPLLVAFLVMLPKVARSWFISLTSQCKHWEGMVVNSFFH